MSAYSCCGGYSDHEPGCGVGHARADSENMRLQAQLETANEMASALKESLIENKRLKLQLADWRHHTECETPEAASSLMNACDNEILDLKARRARRGGQVMTPIERKAREICIQCDISFQYVPMLTAALQSTRDGGIEECVNMLRNREDLFSYREAEKWAIAEMLALK